MIWPRQALSGHNLLCSETRCAFLQLSLLIRFGLAALNRVNRKTSEGTSRGGANHEADQHRAQGGLGCGGGLHGEAGLQQVGVLDNGPPPDDSDDRQGSRNPGQTGSSADLMCTDCAAVEGLKRPGHTFPSRKTGSSGHRTHREQHTQRFGPGPRSAFTSWSARRCDRTRRTAPSREIPPRSRPPRCASPTTTPSASERETDQAARPGRADQSFRLSPGLSSRPPSRCATVMYSTHGWM
jgi:hypothetical protein